MRGLCRAVRRCGEGEDPRGLRPGAGRLAGPPHTVELVDIDADPAITDEYTIRVPVVEVDGEEVAQYQVNEAVLAGALGA
ncbi:MAG: glutaredoxin family protein [Actinomycetota bacterium]